MGGCLGLFSSDPHFFSWWSNKILLGGSKIFFLLFFKFFFLHKCLLWGRGSKTGQFKNLGKKTKHTNLLILSFLANIRTTFFDQKSPQHPEVDIFWGGSKSVHFNNLRKKPHRFFGRSCHHMPIIGICSLTRRLHNLRWCFTVAQK